jgi:hypothetical protein
MFAPNGKTEVLLKQVIEIINAIALSPAAINIKPLTGRHFGLSKLGTKLTIKQVKLRKAITPIQTHLSVVAG